MTTPTATAPEPGAEIPPFERTVGLHHWNRYAAVNDEFVNIHMDDDAGREAGYPGAFGMGNLQWSYLHAALRQWIGEEGRIVTVSCQFRGPMLKGSLVRARGVVTATQVVGPETTVDLELWTENGAGQRMVRGRATVAWPTPGQPG